MARAKGVQAHKVFKLGKAAAEVDVRNLRFAAVLKAGLPALPPSYDFDVTHPGIPTPMFANDTYGDCVIAGRAHQTLRFEDIEQGALITITDKDVTREYLKETGGPDIGLVVLESLKLWRKRGWKAARETYKIKAFAQIDFRNHEEVRQAISPTSGSAWACNCPIQPRARCRPASLGI